MYIDGVFQGGGVKGVGFAGAIKAVEEAGHQFRYLAGTSAGAIIAALVAAGYTADELQHIFETLDYTDFKQLNFPIPAINLFLYDGLYDGGDFLDWITSLLKEKNITCFRELGGRLKIIASDLTAGRMIVLPDDLKLYNIDPDSFSVAQAVRMSMSIPFFFNPMKLRDNYIVDGGVLSNFPVWLFDGESECPTLGFKPVGDGDNRPNTISGPVSLLGALFKTMLGAHDERYVSEDDWNTRTIAIPTGNLSAVDFGLTPERAHLLWEAGYKAGHDFFMKWDYQTAQAAARALPAGPTSFAPIAPDIERG